MKPAGLFSRNKIPQMPFLDLTELAVLIAAMAVFIFCDPFGLSYKITDFLRLRSALFIKEPRLLAYTYQSIGTLIAKTLALLMIAALLAAKKTGLNENLAIRKPRSAAWRKLIIPFIVIAACVRIYQSRDPLVPNLPIRMVFPEAMVIGNILITGSILFVAPIAEELIFRGYMFDVLKRSFGAPASIGLTSALFAAAHLPQLNYELSGVAVIFAAGLFFAVMRQKEDSILVPVFFHAMYNLVYVVVGSANYLIVGY